MRAPLVVASLFLAACIQRDLGQRVAGVEKKVAEMEKTLQALKDRLEANTGGLDVRLRILEDKEQLVSCADKGYAFLPTALGQFMVMCDDLKPYGDGFKLLLRIGNPHQVTLNGFEFKVRYHPALSTPPEKFIIREKSVSFTEQLWPGAWTRVSMVLAPAKADDLANIWVTMSVNQVALMRR